MGILKSFKVVSDHMNGNAEYLLTFIDGSTINLENGHSGYFSLVPMIEVVDKNSHVENKLVIASIVGNEQEKHTDRKAASTSAGERKARTIRIRNSAEGARA